jgi:hypothetical protein
VYRKILVWIGEGVLGDERLEKERKRNGFMPKSQSISPHYRIFSPPIDTGIDWSAYNLVVGLGDSIMEGLFKVRNVPEALKVLHRPNTTVFNGGASMELNNQTVDLRMDKVRE